MGFILGGCVLKNGTVAAVVSTYIVGLKQVLDDEIPFENEDGPDPNAEQYM